jgi:DNA-binding LacI/PurR family transcriptional regulator
MLGKQPNADVAIAGYDDYWRSAAYYAFDATPPFATVDKCNLEIGAQMVQALVSLTDAPPIAPSRCRFVAPRLVVCD